MSRTALEQISLITEVAALAFILGAMAASAWETRRWNLQAGGRTLRTLHAGSLTAGIVAAVIAFALALHISYLLLH
ncbi:hypothetical protein M0638_05950 [Roseomonas sp. NAR14]|uniref:Uncharacterized protein n=1 Tax=Roseomonas acroporae TaxID=2937791 RepID=A0A9X1Y677_9PROT|nr:hypothetical protein [Roseomonas acroporae]MCK8783923.1 hypothetical protein [Roseomonas acroporae]